LHEAIHWLVVPDAEEEDEHSPLHCASACALQSVSQSKFPGCAMQFASQSPWQLPVQSTLALPVHMSVQLASSCAEHAASK
jgi:hypothetical protein